MAKFYNFFPCPKATIVVDRVVGDFYQFFYVFMQDEIMRNTVSGSYFLRTKFPNDLTEY
jgi:hypothetical protein